MKRVYTPPDFIAIESDLRNRNELRNAAFLAAPADGILPDRFYTSTNHPTYIRLGGAWRLIQRPRIDCAIFFDQTSGELMCVEPQLIHCGDPVLVGQAPMAEHEVAWQKSISEHGEEGIYVHTDGFRQVLDAEAEYEDERVRTAGDPLSIVEIDYDAIAELIEEHRNTTGRFAIWVLAPTVAHSRARSAMQWLIEYGYVGAVFGGNDLALYDIEKAMLDKSPGRKLPSRRERLALRNKMRQVGTIRAAIAAELIHDGIMYACHEHGVPMILAGSMRDTCLLPEVIADPLVAQQLMQELAMHATLAVMIGGGLHSVATERMLPIYVERDDTIAPVEVISVNSTLFSLAKLTERSVHRVSGGVCAAEEFLDNLVAALKWNHPRSSVYKTLEGSERMQAQGAPAILHLDERQPVRLKK